MGITGDISYFYPLFFLAVIAGVTLLAIVLHELGHCLFALACGYRVSNLKLFRLSVSFGRGVVSLSCNNSGVKGQCLVFDRDGLYGKKAGLTVLGGSLFNLFAGLLGMSPLFAGVGLYGLTMWMSFSVMNLFFAVSNLIPRGCNDGATFAEIRRFGSENYNKLMNIASARELGQSLCEMDPVWFVPSAVGGSMAVELRGLRSEKKMQEKGYRFKK